MEDLCAARYMISECSDLTVTLALVGPAPELAKTPVGARLWDLGPEGASFICPWDRALLALPEGQHLELVLTYEGNPMVLDGGLVRRTKVAGRAVTLEMSFLDTLRGFDGKVEVPKLLEQLRARGLVRALARRPA